MRITLKSQNKIFISQKFYVKSYFNCWRHYAKLVWLKVYQGKSGGYSEIEIVFPEDFPTKFWKDVKRELERKIKCVRE